MDCVPELSVAKRKSLSHAKMAKRLRRFVLDNQRTDAAVVQPPLTGDEGEDHEQSASAELVCRVPDETLFQLQQIYEALEANAIRSRRTGHKNASQNASVLPPKTPAKRSRGPDAPATEVINRQADGGTTGEGEKSKKKKKKDRRKSAAT